MTRQQRRKQDHRRLSLGIVPAILIAICVTGAIALPFGDPRLIVVAIPVEGIFIALALLTAAGYKKALYACLPLAVVVIVGNSLAPPHVQIMTTFSKPLNAVVLIIGGYILQVALIVAVTVNLSRQHSVLKRENIEH